MHPTCVNRVFLASAIAIMVLGIGTAYSQQSEIPSWIKTVASFWADDKISDEEFVNALEYLINAGVIQIDGAAPRDELGALANYDALVEDYDSLADDYDGLVADYNALVYDYSVLAGDYDELIADYNDLVDDHNERYPLVTISDAEVTWEFYDSKENFYSWSMPIATYEDMIEFSRDYSIQQGYYDPKHIIINGHTVPVLNLDGFVTNSFSDVIDEIYHNSHDNSDFVYEIWYIVSLLTVYDEDVTPESEGRFPLVTFTRTGGDCEDLVILIADMLMSSKYTNGWEFQYVMMDSGNPLDPQKMNHVILHVGDGQYSYFIEATASPNWNYYPNGVNGWWFDVV